MNHRPLGESGPSASIIALGAWVLGGGPIWGTDARDYESIQAIHAALDHGINLIDTAPAYGFGRSEEIVGRAIRGRRGQGPDRDQMRSVVERRTGLVFHRVRWPADLPEPPPGHDPDRGRGQPASAGHGLHRPLPDPLAVGAAGPHRHRGHPRLPARAADQGKIAIGVCNVSVDELHENRARGPIASNQFRYSMLHREAEADILPLCASTAWPRSPPS